MKRITLWCTTIITAAFVMAGCYATYSKDKVEDSVKKICRDEYGVTNVEVVIKGKTIGVYLPLEQLFSVDYEKFLAGAAVGDLDSLMQFHPDALDKVEDVLFTTSRVILSTDRDLQFYLLNATDTSVTGIQFTIVGNVEDMKRVRFWDISRDDYRKRLIHDLSINKTIMWKRPIVRMFSDLSSKGLDDVLAEYFMTEKPLSEIAPAFYQQLVERDSKKDLKYTIEDIRAKPLESKQVLVYAKVRETSAPKDGIDATAFRFKSDFVGEYLFVMNMIGMDFKIAQVLPFHFVNEQGVIENIQFPPDLAIYQNLDQWPQDFEFEEVTMKDFIAEQITKRVEALLAYDEQIQKDFTERRQNSKIQCMFETVPAVVDTTTPEVKAEDRFVYYLTLRLRDKLFITAQDLQENERMQYLLDLVLREGYEVFSAYRLQDYDKIEIRVPLMKQSMVFDREAFEKFGKKKLPINAFIQQGVLQDVL